MFAPVAAIETIVAVGRIEAGRKLDVFYDPANPEKIDLS
jgi:hypothetical protein